MLDRSHAVDVHQDVPSGQQTDFDFRSLSLSSVVSNRYQPTPLPSAVQLTAEETKALVGDPDPCLTLEAHRRLLRFLTEAGNVLSHDHSLALLMMLSQFTRHALGATTGRIPIALPTGMGKTQGIVAWCSAAHDAGFFAGGGSIAVAAMRVEALCDLFRDMERAGIARKLIGLMHSVECDPKRIADAAANGFPPPAGYASMPPDPHASSRPILLATHGMIRTKIVERFNRYRGAPRSLLFWDEALLVSESGHMDTGSLEFALRALSPHLAATSSAAKFLKSAVSALKAEIDRQESGARPQVVVLDQVDANAITKELNALKKLLYRGHQKETVSDLIRFVKMAAHRLAVVATSRDTGLITYQITIPAELTSIIVLDASYPIRRLCHFDQSMAPELALPPDLKDFSDVDINLIRTASGRVKVEDDLERHGKCSPFVQAVVEIVKSIPADEGIIIFGFKSRGRIDHIRLLRDALADAGIAVDAMLAPGKRRINFLTWGNESSLSNLKHCANIIFASIMNRSHFDLTAAVCGQRNNLAEHPDPSTVEDVATGELVHIIYQAISRGQCRVVHNGKALPTKIWLPLPDTRIRSVLEQVMPGVKWRPLELESLGKLTKTERLAWMVADLLQTLAPTCYEIASMALCQRIPDLGAVTDPKTKSRAISLGAELAGWIKTKGGKAVKRRVEYKCN